MSQSVQNKSCLSIQGRKALEIMRNHSLKLPMGQGVKDGFLIQGRENRFISPNAIRC